MTAQYIQYVHADDNGRLRKVSTRLSTRRPPPWFVLERDIIWHGEPIRNLREWFVDTVGGLVRRIRVELVADRNVAPVGETVHVTGPRGLRILAGGLEGTLPETIVWDDPATVKVSLHPDEVAYTANPITLRWEENPS